MFKGMMYCTTKFCGMIRHMLKIFKDAKILDNLTWRRGIIMSRKLFIDTMCCRRIIFKCDTTHWTKNLEALKVCHKGERFL